MLISSPVFSQVSGSIAGLTYAHGRSGMIVKPRRIPTNPATARQLAVRHSVLFIARRWSEQLTLAQRSAWTLYAANVPMKNALGQTIFLHGLNHYMRSNIPRLQTLTTIVDSAPTNFNLGTFTRPAIQLLGEAQPDQINILFNIADEWALETGSHMLVYSGKPVSVGSTFYRHPWRYAGRADGAPGGIVSPVRMLAPWPFRSTFFLDEHRNIAWIRCRISRADGRLSPSIVLGPAQIKFPP